MRRPAPLLSCTIITTDAVGPLAEIHDRMPLMVGESDWDRWLDPDAPLDDGLLRGRGDRRSIEIREVSTLVNNVRNNGPELIEPAEPQGRQATLRLTSVTADRTAARLARRTAHQPL